MFGRFRDDEDGVGTVWSIFWLIVFLAIGGLAVDSANARRNKEILQTAADSAAAAAVLEIADLDEAREAAIEMADLNLAMIGSDDVLSEENIVFGVWDSEDHTFTETESSPNAVKVYLAKTTATGNAVPTFLLDIVGINSWDVSASSIVMVSGSTSSCLDESGQPQYGLYAGNTFDTKSFNTYKDGICVHGQQQLNMWRQNEYDDDVVLTTNVQSEIDYILTAKIPHHTEANQNNLRAALEKDSIVSLEPGAVVSTITAIQNGTSTITPQFVSNMSIISKTRSEFQSLMTAGTYLTGRVYYVTGCTTTGTSSSNTISVPSGRNLSDIVIVTNCRIAFAGTNTITNTLIATQNTSTTSIVGSSAITIGQSASCSTKGDAQFLTAGTMQFAQNTDVNGSKLVAAVSIKFQSASAGNAVQADITASTLLAGSNIEVKNYGSNHPTLSSVYNAHTSFYEPYTGTYKYYDTWFGQDYIGSNFKGCGADVPMSTSIVG
jgi:hypothetical protein